ncbi:hypothetical protein GCM10009765_32520 [Fodinicola feengrottensis]|uniref:Uncharacterized protein n=1 Tax=Fodinicola feengrottensis TaxID=435914 RepID=A0ABN2H2F9_9ACTN
MTMGFDNHMINKKPCLPRQPTRTDFAGALPARGGAQHRLRLRRKVNIRGIRIIEILAEAVVERSTGQASGLADG